VQDGTNIADYMASRTPARDRVLVFSHEKSAVRAAQIGWDTASLLGCHPTRPLDPLNGAGLLWRISGGKITAMQSDWATIEIDGVQHIFHRRPTPTTFVLPWRRPAP
jgi:hypothetical protein